jgi:hypothetical protein
MKKIVEMQSKKKEDDLKKKEEYEAKLKEIEENKKKMLEEKRREELEKQKAREHRLATSAINVPIKSNILANKENNNYDTLSTFKPGLLLNHQNQLQQVKPKFIPPPPPPLFSPVSQPHVALTQASASTVLTPAINQTKQQQPYSIYEKPIPIDQNKFIKQTPILQTFAPPVNPITNANQIKNNQIYSNQINQTYTYSKKAIESYDISDLCSEDETDDEEQPIKPIPAWARDPLLIRKATEQSRSMINFTKLFKESAKNEIILENIFKIKRKNFNQRSSSANWSSPPIWRTGLNGDESFRHLHKNDESFRQNSKY